MAKMLEDDKGQKSSGRVIALCGSFVGLALCLAGGVASLLGQGDGLGLATIGAALYGAGAGSKMGAKFAESKKG